MLVNLRPGTVPELVSTKCAHACRKEEVCVRLMLSRAWRTGKFTGLSHKRQSALLIGEEKKRIEKPGVEGGIQESEARRRIEEE